MRLTKETYTVTKTALMPEDDYNAEMIDLMASRFEELDRESDHVMYSNHMRFSNFCDAVRRAIYKKFNDLAKNTHNKLCNILIVYHRDLDGGTAGILSLAMIKEFANEYSDTIDSRINMVSINYQDKFNHELAEKVKIADIIICVDYSFSNLKHTYVINNPDATVLVIDHHETSLDLMKKSDMFKNYMYGHNTFYCLAELKDVSAALLCYFIYSGIHSKSKYIQSMMDDTNDFEMAVVRSVPEYILRVSLYDTFSKYADRAFMLGVNTIKHMPFDLVDEDISDNDYSESSIKYKYVLVYFGLLFYDSAKKGISINLFNKDTMYYDSITVVSKRILNLGNDCINSIQDIIKTGNILLSYDKQINKMACMRCMFEADVYFGYTEHGLPKVYNVAIINRSGNSYIFEDEYYRHDGVILFALNKHLTYTYSFFTDKHSDNTNKLPCKDIAEKFGGGGHPTAAGCTLDINLFDKGNGFVNNSAISSNGHYIIDFNKKLD